MAPMLLHQNRLDHDQLTVRGNYDKLAGALGMLKKMKLGEVPAPYLFGAPGRIRTHDPLVRSQVLYPTELRALRKNREIVSNPAMAKHKKPDYGAGCWVRLNKPRSIGVFKLDAAL